MKFAGRITVKKLKGLSQLTFDVPKGGVYLICGANGTGKSSLLACLHRIGFSNAFPDAFRTSRVSKQLDNFDDTEITYTVDTRTVKYIYGGQRWVPSPRKNASVLDDFGFSTVLYIGADAARIEPRREDFTPRKVKDASDFIRTHATFILDSEKFSGLKVVNVKRGMTSAFLLMIPIEEGSAASKQSYFSERNFSLGELCILKLLRNLESCPNDSLLLIDEVELALHPTAQVRLLTVLKTIADSKRLTVFVATHSVSLINAVDRRQLLLLARTDNNIECVPEPYHAAAIGAVTPVEDRQLDCVIAVEDDCAASILRAIVDDLSKADEASNKPFVQVFPVGTFEAVMNFVNKSAAILPTTTKVFGLVDKDVEVENKKSWTQNENYDKLSLLKNLGERIGYLPWTPEVGVAGRFRCDIDAHQVALRSRFGNNTKIELDRDALNAISIATGAHQRKLAKKWMRSLVTQICSATALSDLIVEERVLSYFSFVETNLDRSTFQQLLGPMLNSK